MAADSPVVCRQVADWPVPYPPAPHLQAAALRA